jgi:hypothetical protein
VQLVEQINDMLEAKEKRLTDVRKDGGEQIKTGDFRCGIAGLERREVEWHVGNARRSICSPQPH